MSEKLEYFVPEIEDYDDRQYAQKNLDPLSLIQLIERFSKSVDHKTGDILNAEDYWNCLTAIRNLLNIVTNENINKAIDNILRRIEKFEARFRNHRHDLSRNFCGKAEY